MEKLHQITFEHYSSLESMPAQDQELISQALEATKRANASYSGFRVGAAARLSNGEIISAANTESEVFPSGLCAERSLLYFYQSNYSPEPIRTLAIVSDPSPRECYPCGACRQVILDVENRQQSPIRIIMWGAGTASVVGSAKDLLPFTFKL